MSWSIRPEFVPGTDRGMNCSICHSDLRDIRDGDAEPHRERVFTTGELIEMEGLFSICETCIREAAHMAGFIPPERAKALGKKNRELGQENGALRKQLEALDLIRSVLA